MNQANSSQPYRHPGEAFLAKFGVIRSVEDVNRYVEFLREESGLSDEPPIDLSQIYRHFGMPTPIRAPLDEQQGILVNSRTGIILIKETDPIVRQRFTEGHELMELLFDAIDQTAPDSMPWNEQQKERLCDQGAADLLMPHSSFLPNLSQLGLSLASAKTIATLYQTSLLATLVRMMQCGEDDCALVMWHSSLKPTEERSLSTARKRPPKKLRIWWRMQTAQWTGGFIPKSKSIANESLIAQAFVSGQVLTGQDTLHLADRAIDCYVEAMPMQIGEKPCVLSLLHKT